MIHNIYVFFNRIKNIIREKFWFAFGAFLFVMFCFLVTNVKATSYNIDYSYDNVDYHVQAYDEDKGFIVVCDSKGVPWRNYFVGKGDYNIKPFRYNADSNYIEQLSDTNFYGIFTKNSNSSYIFKFSDMSWGNIIIPDGGFILYSNRNIYNTSDNSIYLPANTVNTEYISPFEKPYIETSASEIATLGTHRITIRPGSIPSSDNMIFGVYLVDDDNTTANLFNCSLNIDSSHYVPMFDENGSFSKFYYSVWYTDMGIVFEKGKKYKFTLTYVDLSGALCIDEKNVVMGNTTETEKIEDTITSGFNDLSNKLVESNNKTQEAINKQTEAIEENNKTNKNIFEKIGDILSFINPFSENFFAYKLVELLMNGIKSLFIPSDDFFSSFFTELNDWFSDRFGFLYYPLNLFFDLCNRFLNINFNEPVINIPDIIEPSTKLVFIHAITYNFNSLLENDILKTVHDIYFIIVDAVIYVGLAILLYNKYEEVMTK